MTAVYGNGMMGRALAGMISGEIEFIDGKLNNIEEVLSHRPERVVLGVLDAERQSQMREALSEHGYDGEIITYPAVFDVRTAVMRLMADSIPEGTVAELGVYKGDFAAELAKSFPGREMHLFDSFRGFDGMFTDTSAEAVQRRLPKAVIHEGYFPDTFEAHDYAFISLDADLYEPTKAGLEMFSPCMVPGGIIMIHDYNSGQFPGVKTAVDEFCADKKKVPLPVGDLHGTVIITF